ncbi:poly-gamma-glutamate hydrolase family protein [Nonomuraea sp. SMC257]|uniref:Poly-gamma-glutamate hydrolase family protein n=1 Tax=Nonomuraea montanisoli TaxID=2741721 RepID=A0A7Y6I7H6_9ACTN|nr:poly-gamma-glutamate hydrolase family protein [Nonomuraea montanisoli]NUW33135.1 poly-gamma-glutamate hydrolase family protein [Nonomuraea montanisoli]
MKRILSIAVANALVMSLAPAALAESARPAAPAEARDVYADYAELSAHEVEGKDYRRVLRVPRGAKVAHIAIHGGAIEAPTSQLADQAAGRRDAYYAFEGIKATGNSALHITATHFDEPRALKVVAGVDRTVSWHAASGSDATTYVGGRDTALIRKVKAELRAAGFAVSASVPEEIGGDSPGNIANRNRRGMGVQLEISRGQRERFFKDGRLERAWVENPANRTKAFYAYVAAVDRAVG